MKTKSILVLAMVVKFLTATNLCNAVQYEIVDLGTLGGAYSIANGINDNGQIVGYSRIEGEEAYHAFLWANGVMNDLGTLPNHEYSSARSINNSGDIVGGSSTAYGEAHPFIYKNGTMSQLNMPEEHEQGNAFGINENGQVVGISGVYLISGQTYAFFNNSGIATSICNGSGLGINNSGNLVGETVTDGQDSHAFIYKDGHITSLYSLLGHSVANAINNKDQVVGSAHDDLRNQYGYIYDNGFITDVGNLGGTLTFAKAINDKGQVVGYSETESGYWHAFLYYNETISDLGTLSGHSQSFATGINENGWIVGYSQNTIFDARAVLWRPIPEPATILLLGFGAVLLRRKS